LNCSITTLSLAKSAPPARRALRRSATFVQIADAQIKINNMMSNLSLMFLVIIVFVGGASIANYMYANDSGSHAAYDSSAGPGALWMGNEYYANQKLILLCPSTHEPAAPIPNANLGGAADLAWDWGQSVTPPLTGSYAINGWLYDSTILDFGENTQFLFGKESAIEKPTLTPVFMDSVWVDLWPSESDAPARNVYNPLYSSTAGMGRCTIARHGGSVARAPTSLSPGQVLPGAINMGLADGHAEQVKLQTLWNYYWHLRWVPPATRPL